jgi:hypothetical protein
MATDLNRTAIRVHDHLTKGYIVRVQVDHAAPLLLSPAEAHELAQTLMATASDAMHADRAVRRG